MDEFYQADRNGSLLACSHGKNKKLETGYAVLIGRHDR
jgi:hypothetical protein